MDLSIIIVNWRSTDFLKLCLASIRKTACDLDYEVIVVDNASFDGCEGMVRSEFPFVTFIQSRENLGFSRANNLAFAQCKGRNVLFLNPDTEIQAGALQRLLSSLESIPRAGMVGARLLNSDLSLQTTCVAAIPSILNQTLNSNHLRRAFPKLRMWGMRPLFEDPTEPVGVEAISGACMMARRDMIERVGGFSSDFFMYSEDMDLCLRIVKCGWKIYYVPDARIVHHAAGSSSLRQESNFSAIMLRESFVRFIEIHRGRRYAMLFRAITGLIGMARILLLVATLPIAISPRSRQFTFRALTKWSGVLAWSLGFKQWATAQQRVQPAISPTVASFPK